MGVFFCYWFLLFTSRGISRSSSFGHLTAQTSGLSELDAVYVYRDFNSRFFGSLDDFISDVDKNPNRSNLD